jgi:hypothetical protein
MNHTRDYYRKMRVKHINRKKQLCSNWSCCFGSWYPYDGMYSKGKIHCSCGMCANKTRNKGRRTKNHSYLPSINYNHSDMQHYIDAQQQINEYYNKQ